MAAASGVGQEFRIVLSPKVKTKNSTSSVYSSLYGMYVFINSMFVMFTLIPVNMKLFFVRKYVFVFLVKSVRRNVMT